MSRTQLLRGSIGLAVAFTFGISGCKKAEELAAKATGKDTPEETDKADGGDKKEEAAEEGGGGGDKVEPEPIPVAPMKSGLDLMLSFVPDDKHEFVIVRDATVLTEYWEEALRFVETPMSKISSMPNAPQELQGVPMMLALGKGQGDKVLSALKESGLKLEEGVAMVMPQGNTNKALIIFNADTPDAFTKIAQSFGGDTGKATCIAIPDMEKWNVCGEDKAMVEAYKPAADAGAVRAVVASKLENVEIDEANVIVHVTAQGNAPVTVAITTLPGLLHIAGTGPFDQDPEVAKLLTALQRGPQKTLANVQPGAGFIWGHTTSAVMGQFVAESTGGDAPPEAKKIFEAMTGEFVLAGSVDPGGLVFEASISDSSAFTPFIELAIAEYAKEGGPKPIPDIPGSKVVLDRAEIDHAGTKADALHIGIEGIPQADALKAFAGIYPDAWAFTSGETLTVALGPNKESVGKLMGGAGEGPSADTLASLPQPLARGLQRQDVSFALHMPMDFLQGAHMHKLVRAGLKNVPDLDPELVLSALSLLSPLSSASVWIEQPASGTPLFHMAVHGIGNRATAEGKEALDAAHAITQGTDPESAFKPLAEKYNTSAMAFAYVTRAGTEGPGSLIGSGVGPLLIGGVLAYSMRAGKVNEGLATDLGVDPSAAPPDLTPETLPVAPVHEDPTQPTEEATPTEEPTKPTTDAEKPKYEPKKEPKAEPKKEPVPEPKKEGKKGKEKTPIPPIEPKKGKKGKQGKKQG